tara:strand:+ start:454 stop:666 length:213 start_codon:yes stop_codon:yes gene_type:complete
MKHDQLNIEINSEPELALVLHIEGLTKEYNRIVTSTAHISSANENNKALDLIIVKINQCKETLNWVKEIY